MKEDFKVTSNREFAGGFATEEAMFEAIFKEMKLDGLFSDFPDHPIEYLKKNGLR